MQTCQRKQQRLALHKRQDFISTNWCDGCNNRTTSNPSEWCEGCPMLEELRKIGQELIKLSDRDDMIDWEDKKTAKKHKFIADYKELKEDGLSDKVIAEILGISESAIRLRKREYNLREVMTV